MSAVDEATTQGPGGVDVGHAVRIYDSLRSAHLERAQQQSPATIFYGSRRYDFDESLAQGLQLVHASTPQMVRRLIRSTVTIAEINEPLMRGGLPRAAAAVAAVRLRGLVTRSRTLVVTYAIENRNPYTSSVPLRVKARIRRVRDQVLSALLARQVDRIVFGTEDARRLYESMFTSVRRASDTELVEALPAPCDCPAEESDRCSVLFVGALQTRKGFDRLLAAWPAVIRQRPGATLTIVGKGELEADAAAFCDIDTNRATLLVDPPRREVHQQLRGAHVVVLLSQRTPTWREQVGLPLVEALAHGCEVVTTTETGLAGWLEQHGHAVVRPDLAEEELADTIARALDGRRESTEILDQLPAADGRIVADHRLFRAVDEV